MKLFLKQRNMYYMKYWCKHVNDADVAAELSRVYLQEDSDTPIEDLAMFFKEMDAANLLIKEYQLFIDELDDVEYKVLMSYVNDEPLDSMDKSSYESIKVKVFKKWCKKFMVDNLIFIHELDTPKLGNPDTLVSSIKYDDGTLAISNNNDFDFSGKCQLEWRQGVKHDCSSIMELIKIDENLYMNKNKEVINIEKTLVFPLLKSSNFKSYIINDSFIKYVIVTQKKAREDTTYIADVAPLTWNYLKKNLSIFNNRKSSIYKGAPSFSMFGVGEYSYSKYKVGISGFYKKPVFSLIYNKYDEKKPIMLDDTSYFLSFEEYNDAYVCMLLLNSKPVQDFLNSISFKDAKRPYTKKVLQKINLVKAMIYVGYEGLKETEVVLEVPSIISFEMYNNFLNYLNKF